ncbi:preprotein translocase subunit SecE [Candidatus Kaiserbacteria bacterium]|nr:preprotein translocase subunit SecE [Candidatus Kaiserbacteria bacterium]
MAGFGQYLKDTRSELNHVAWPTQTQTIVYTVMVALVSIVVALYLGLFDYLFTGALKRVVEGMPSAVPASSAIEFAPVDTETATQTPTVTEQPLLQ